MVAAIAEQILGPTDVFLANWLVRPSSGCSVVLATNFANKGSTPYSACEALRPSCLLHGLHGEGWLLRGVWCVDTVGPVDRPVDPTVLSGRSGPAFWRLPVTA